MNIAPPYISAELLMNETLVSPSLVMIDWLLIFMPPPLNGDRMVTLG